MHYDNIFYLCPTKIDLSKLLSLITEVWRGLLRRAIPIKRREKCAHPVPKHLHQVPASHISFVRTLIFFLATLIKTLPRPV